MANDKIRKSLLNPIVELTDFLFDLHKLYKPWQEDAQLLEFAFRENVYATTLKKMGWYFMLLVIVPGVPIFDCHSVSDFISYLAKDAGTVMKFLINGAGYCLFIALELTVGWLLIYYRSIHMNKVTANILAVAVTLLPAVLIITTYLLTPNKTNMLLLKTSLFLFVSVILHTLVLKLAKDIWLAGLVIVYKVKKKRLENRNPHKEMKRVKKELQQLFTDLDLYVVSNGNPKGYASYMPNRSWYLKQKFQKGVDTDDFDFSDYDPKTPYAPK